MNNLINTVITAIIDALTIEVIDTVSSVFAGFISVLSGFVAVLSGIVTISAAIALMPVTTIIGFVVTGVSTAISAKCIYEMNEYKNVTAYAYDRFGVVFNAIVASVMAFCAIGMAVFAMVCILGSVTEIAFIGFVAGAFVCMAIYTITVLGIANDTEVGIGTIMINTAAAGVAAAFAVIMLIVNASGAAFVLPAAFISYNCVKQIVAEYDRI